MTYRKRLDFDGRLTASKLMTIDVVVRPSDLLFTLCSFACLSPTVSASTSSFLTFLHALPIQSPILTVTSQLAP